MESTKIINIVLSFPEVTNINSQRVKSALSNVVSFLMKRESHNIYFWLGTFLGPTDNSVLRCRFFPGHGALQKALLALAMVGESFAVRLGSTASLALQVEGDARNWHPSQVTPLILNVGLQTV